VLLGGLGLVLLGLVGYAVFVWRRKKAAQAKFQDSVLGAAAAGAVAGTAEPGPTVQPASSPVPASQAPAGMEAEEVDPIAEADVYIAYGRDAQAEQILKEALQKDAKRTAVHAKLLEIYAARKDTKAFEQTALKVKDLTNGTGAEWEKACTLGRSIDPQNGLYGRAEPSAAPAAAASAAAAAPALDFDLGGSSQNQPAAPDISLEEPPKEASGASGVDIDLGTTSIPAFGGAASEQEKTVTSMDFNLDIGEKKEEPAAAAAAEPSSGLDFDLKLDDLPAEKPEEKSAAPLDLGSISLDLGGAPAEAAVAASPGSTDPKWQEVATKLDLAKAYEEMGDKNGARELLNEVMKDGDAAQKGQAEQLLAKLG
jgi:pilus assembly protein FimV